MDRFDRFAQVIASAISLIFTSNLAASALDDWYEIDKKLCAEIESRGLSAVVKRLRGLSSGASTADWMAAFDAASRADDIKLGDKALAALSTAQPALQKHNLSDMANFLIGREQWQLAKSFVERFPQSEPGWGYVLADHMAQSQSYESLDSWLKSLAKRNPNFWTTVRAGRAHKAGKEQALLAELQADVRKAPELDTLRRYMTALTVGDRKPEPNWLPDSYKPELAFDAWQAAGIVSTNFPSVCKRYLQLSLSRSYTAKDQSLMEEHMKRCSAMPRLAGQNFEKDLRSSCKHMLAQCYQVLGESTKAQALLVELQAENPGGMPVLAMTQFAGQVQSTTLTHPLEQTIKQAEKPNESDPQYWLGRASYYKGRKDDAQTFAALKKALSLSKPGDNPDQSQIMIRMMVLSDYANFLRRNGADRSSIEFLWAQFDQSPSAELRARIVDQVWHAAPSALKFDEPRLWRFLKDKKDWSYLEEHVLMQMAEGCPEASRGKLWTDLEAITGANPTRLLRLGWVMTRENATKLSLPLLVQSRAKLTDPELKRSATFTLFEAYLQLNDWKSADKIFPDAKAQLTPSELPDWISRICVCAARNGEFGAAMRLWRQKDNLDRTYLKPLEELKNFDGLRAQLKTYYQQMQSSDPSSSVAKQALTILR